MCSKSSKPHFAALHTALGVVLQEKVSREREARKLEDLQRRFAANVAKRLSWADPDNVTHLVADGSCPFCQKPAGERCPHPTI